MKLRPPIRQTGGRYQSLMLVYAVATVLVVRLFLELTGYPKLGTRTLHIAHVLWGGLLMLVGANIALVSYGRSARRTSAILTGIGFGLFVDEIGKFVTQDNNYFYRPAAAMIYVCFIVLFLAGQALRRLATSADRAPLVGVIEDLEEVVRGDFDPDEKVFALRSIDRLARSHSHYAPLARQLRHIVAEQRPVTHPPSPIGRLTRSIRARLVSHPEYGAWWLRIVSLFCLGAVGNAAVELLQVIGTVLGPALFPESRIVTRLVLPPTQLSVSLLQTVSSIVASAFLLGGIVRLRHDLRGGLRQVERGLLVLIFFVHVFSFYFSPRTATVSVLISVAFFNVVQELRAGRLVPLPPDGARPAAPAPDGAPPAPVSYSTR